MKNCILQPISMANAIPTMPKFVPKTRKYKIIIPLETRLIIAGILNSPKDCKIPTDVNANAVKIITGNRIRKICAACAAYCGSKSNINTICSENITPRRQIINVKSVVIFIKLFANSCALSLPSSDSFLLNTGMNVDKIAAPRVRSKNRIGNLDAPRKISASADVPKRLANRIALNSPASFANIVIIAILPITLNVLLMFIKVIIPYFSLFSTFCLIFKGKCGIMKPNCNTREGKYMKKLVSIVLVLALSLALVGCFGGNEINGYDNNVNGNQHTEELSTELEPRVIETPTANVGDIVEFGETQWRILDVQNGRALLLREYLLELIPYHNTFADVTWETSDIRQWLNNEFYNGFTSDEQAKIAETNIINNDNPLHGTPGGNDTIDKIFLLSLDEVTKYFDRSDREIALFETGDAGTWWLRSPGNRANRAAIFQFGGPNSGGGAVNVRRAGTRPAMWIYL